MPGVVGGEVVSPRAPDSVATSQECLPPGGPLGILWAPTSSQEAALHCWTISDLSATVNTGPAELKQGTPLGNSGGPFQSMEALATPL